ncbi:MAG: PTS-dependent dihydroxyacetone kinase phosphotransferase subunit DhaM [Chloroflexi bacterium]|nr:PTS-dependent dihydroxyacetone kinase phosphotransferase subunit DhaM [Chloroflexota bacterium]
MIGLLIVSHSAKIAEGTKELAEQMTRGEVPIAAAGGTDDGSLGTSADLIRAAADRLVARGAEALLVLVDLGSAVMSAEIALEDFHQPYRLSNGPLVEGALMAAVEASIGANLAQVAAVAEQTKDLLKVHD